MDRYDGVNKRSQRFLIFALPVLCTTTILHASQCEVPINQISFGSVTLMQNLRSFRLVHPHLYEENGRLFVNGDIDYAYAVAGVTSAGGAEYDSQRDRIIGFSLNYTDGKYASLTTPINIFKNRIVNNNNLPKNGWLLSVDKQTYRYKCSDYKIEIKQDYGMGKGTSGARVSVFSRYSDLFADNY